jgi:Bacterial Ig-like domain
MGPELVPETTQLSPGATLRFTLVNHGPGRVGYGYPYQVERQEVEEWAEADVEEPATGFILPALAMPAGGTFPQELRLRADVSPGRYRVIKHVAIDDPRGVILNFEFAVVATDSPGARGSLRPCRRKTRGRVAARLTDDRRVPSRKPQSRA